jgi:hypothetical protein
VRLLRLVSRREYFFCLSLFEFGSVSIFEINDLYYVVEMVWGINREMTSLSSRDF